MRLTAAGRLGIGIASPAYPLHVSGYIGSPSLAGKYFNYSAGLTQSTQSYNVSIYATNGIATSDVFVAFSDRRAKILEAPPTESFSDLVQKVQVHQYTWIDKVEKGERKRIGFFAQEVEQVLPDAVGATRGVVPTVHRQAEAFTDTTITITGHGITTEKKLEVVDTENGKHKAEIIRVVDADTLEVKFDKVPKHKLFVVGPEVDDSRVVNHDYLMAVSFGAVKELIEENTQLKAQMAAFEARLTAAGL